MRLVAVWALAACGRIGFEPSVDAPSCSTAIPCKSPLVCRSNACVALDAGTADDAPDTMLAGLYTIAPAITYTCAVGLVDIGVTTFTFSTAGATLTVTSDDVGSPQQPCVMTGPAPTGSSFSVSCVNAGACNESYALTASSSSSSGWTGTFTASFTGDCLDCTTQMFAVTGSQ